MAFPVGWAGYDSPSSLAAPSASLTDFTYLISLDHMSATWWATVKSDGGDIRASKSDDTQLPCDLIEFDHGNQTGLLAVKFTGTQATTPDDIRIWCGKADESLPAASDTYGQHNAYPDSCVAVYPSGGGNDRTANGNNLSMAGSPTVGGASGPIDGSKATDYNGSTQYGLANAVVPTAAPMTHLGLAKLDNLTAFQTLIGVSNSSSFQNSSLIQAEGGDASDPFSLLTGNGIVHHTHGGSYPLSTWFHGAGQEVSSTSRYVWLDGTKSDEDTANVVPSGINQIIVARFHPLNNGYANGLLSFLELHAVALPDAWIEYRLAMLDASDPDQSEFYGTWTWTAASADHSLTADDIATAVPSVGSPAIAQTHALAGSDIATAAPTVGTPTLTESNHTLAADDIATAAPSTGTPSIQQSHALAAASVATGSPVTGSPTFQQLHSLVALAVAAGVPSVGNPEASQIHALAAADVATGAPTVGTPKLNPIVLDLGAVRVRADNRSIEIMAAGGPVHVRAENTSVIITANEV